VPQVLAFANTSGLQLGLANEQVIPDVSDHCSDVSQSLAAACCMLCLRQRAFIRLWACYFRAVDQQFQLLTYPAMWWSRGMPAVDPTQRHHTVEQMLAAAVREVMVIKEALVAELQPGCSFVGSHLQWLPAAVAALLKFQQREVSPLWAPLLCVLYQWRCIS
jgi:hypothetical protein